ncbi:MAG: DUF3793 family protein [Lachnospiraceae bacterium]|nr:DUF3793 family protein [Lachnospiraceae bacterium]
MGTERIRCILGQQCAPVIAGIKPSNLLIVEQGNQNGLRHALRGTELNGYLLHRSTEKDYWLLYDPKVLRRLLTDIDRKQYLQACGYDTGDLKAVLGRLAARFQRYKQGEAEFPHEMGVLFGYPLKDVTGFIENGGRNFKMSGYWKVYDDVTYANRIFKLYEYVKETVLGLCREGVEISDIRKQFQISGHPLPYIS